MKQKILLFLFLLATASTQQLNYTIMNDEDTLGNFGVSRMIVSDTTVFSVKSDFTIHFLGKRQVKQSSKSHYFNNQLIKYSMNSDQNGDIYYANITKNESSYLLDIETRKTEKKEIYQQIILNGITTLYFNEPINIDKIFSENSGEYVQIEEIKPHTYEFTVNGNDWVFYYKNGQLYKAEFDGIFDFTFYLEEN